MNMPETEYLNGGDCMNLAERYNILRCFKMEIRMESTLLPYQTWTAELLHLRSCTKSLLLPDYDMECLMYFLNLMGLGLNIDSQGVCVLLETDEHFRPIGLTRELTPLRNPRERAG
jgi:hypothetical protein